MFCRQSCTSVVREKEQHTLRSSELRKFNGKCHNCLTRFSGKVHLIIYCVEDRVGQNCQGDLLSHRVMRFRKNPQAFYSSQSYLGAAGSAPSPRLGQWFMSRGLCMHNQFFIWFSYLAKISKFSVVFINHLWRICCGKGFLNFREQPSEVSLLMETPGMQPAAVQERSGPGLSTLVIFACQQGSWVTIPGSPWLPCCHLSS